MNAQWPHKKSLLSATILSVVMLAGVIAISSSEENEPAISKPAEEAYPIDLDKVMRQVLAYNKNNEHQKAIELLVQTIEGQPKGSILRGLLVQTFEVFLQDEISLGRAQISVNRYDPESYGRVANALELLNNESMAGETLLEGLHFNPKATSLWMKVASLELKSGRKNANNEALDIFKEVIRLDPKDGDALNNAAFILSRTSISDDLKQAEAYALRALKINPKNADYLDTLAEINFRLGEKKKALSLIEKAIKINPDKEILKEQLKRFQEEQVMNQE